MLLANGAWCTDRATLALPRLHQGFRASRLARRQCSSTLLGTAVERPWQPAPRSPQQQGPLTALEALAAGAGGSEGCPAGSAQKFGRWTLRSRLLLAPLESVSDCAYRRLCHELGAGFTWTEMVRAAALARRNAATISLIDTHDPSTPTGVQLLTSRPRELRDALATLEELAASSHPHWASGIHGIDLNFGCPSPDVIRHGAGPALLKRTRRLGDIFDVLADWRAQTSLPVGVIGAKIRLGLNAEEESHDVFLRAVESARGRLDYVTVHARHAKDESTSSARWERIRAAKEVAGDTLAVVGNGDAFTRADAVAMLAATGCDAVLVARGAIRSAGLVFAPGWDGDLVAARAAIASVEERYATLSAQFGGPREKYARYHEEAFRRIRRQTPDGGGGTAAAAEEAWTMRG